MKNATTYNRLQNEQSLYLRMHAQNPVDWQPWGDDALAQAQSEGKLLIISIGYAACHWCHVMEHESFADTEVAQLMNKKFVSIKVDREERPDIDQVYMDAARLITGRGGWPLNIIALPDGRAVYAGTYFPRESWMDILTQIADMYETDPQRLLNQAEAVHEGINQIDPIVSIAKDETFEPQLLADTWKIWHRSVDKLWGGSGSAPKFPFPSAIDCLLSYAYFTEDKYASSSAQLQLDLMAGGGIYDHLGGGFSRYSTDAQWHVPHFEKMLYDNALLLSTYADAYRIYKDARYRRVVEQTAKFLLEDLAHPQGGFYSALDADSEGEEGKYYLWTKNEIDAALGKDAEYFCQQYGITESGNWEHGNNILSLTYNRVEQDRFLREIDTSRIDTDRQILLDLRLKRTPPATDDKMVAAWNAMAIGALADAASAIGDAELGNQALRHGEFFMRTFISDGLLYRNFKHGGQLKTLGFLDDYAFTIQAFIKIYQRSLDEKWLNEAHRLLGSAIELFEDDGIMLFYTSAKHEVLSARKAEIHDNVIPSSNSVMAHNMLALGTIYGDETLVARARKMVKAVSENMSASGEYLSNWNRLYQIFTFGNAQAVFTGELAAELKNDYEKSFHPGVLVCGSKVFSDLPIFSGKQLKGQSQIHVCIGKVCTTPVDSVSEAEKTVLQRKLF